MPIRLSYDPSSKVPSCSRTTPARTEDLLGDPSPPHGGAPAARWKAEVMARVQQSWQSPDCLEGGHTNCPHRYGEVGILFGKKPDRRVMLCQCACHAKCPVASDKPILLGAWCLHCDCRGAAGPQAKQVEDDEALAERKRQVNEIRAGVDTSHPRSRADIRSELERAYADRGIEPNSYELDTAAGGLEAISGPKHLQGPRVIGVFARLISDAVRDFRRAGDD
jgi:hypothetical protein